MQRSGSPSMLFPEMAGCPGAAFLDTATESSGAFSILTCHPVETLRDQVPSFDAFGRAPIPEGEPPFQTGWIGFLSYESASLWNRELLTLPPEPGLPLAWWGRYEASLAFRHADGAWFLCHSDGARGNEAAERLLALSGASPAADHRGTAAPADFRSSLLESEHGQRVNEILEWIARGHIYQANLTYRISSELKGAPVGLYLALRASNPAPYGAFLAPMPEGSEMPVTLQSSSPELFLRVRGRSIDTSPIKGTRPRGWVARAIDPEADRRLREELLSSSKDRAELTMIVDLERNDLGRICRIGSIRTGPFPRVETYETVHHLVADVSGELREGIDFLSILAATFPGGSVTGAPKIRAMEILAQLETRARFVYCGALGYLDHGGDVELALTIRTLWTRGTEAHFGVGGGIVADSTAASEWEETLHKARGLLDALGQGSWTR